MPREEEEVQALDESFNTRLERALAQDASGNLTLEPSRSLPRSPLAVKQSKEQSHTDGYLSDDDKFQQLLDKKLKEEQEKLEREGIPAQNGVPLVPIKPLAAPRSAAEKRKFVRDESSTDKENRPTDSSNPPASAAPAHDSTHSAATSDARAESPDGLSTKESVESVVPDSSSSRSRSIRRESYVVTSSQPSTEVTDANCNVSVVAELPSSTRRSAAEARDRKTYVIENQKTPSVVEVADATPAVDVNDKKLKTPRKAGVNKLAAGTPIAGGAKTDASSVLGRVVVPATLTSSAEMQDPKLLKENNRRLAQELSRARIEMREMHDHHEKERQDLQDEIVRLRQLAGEKDDGMREMLEKRVERALTCHNGALEKVATLLGDDVPTKLHCRISFILENATKLKALVEEVINFLSGEAQPRGKLLSLIQLVSCIHDHAQEHDEMVRNFVEKLSDAQLNLQLALEDDVDFLSSSAMPTIMNPLNASTMYHDKSRLQQILSDKTESLQRNEGDAEDADVAAHSQPSHELSNVMEEDENKRGSSYLLTRKRSSAVTRRTSAVPQPQSVESEETVRRSRNSRRESMRLSSGFPQAIFKSPRVSQLQTDDDGGTPANRGISMDAGSPSSVDGSPDVLDRPVLSPSLSLTEAAATPSLPFSQAIALDWNASAQNATSTESNDMELTTSEPAPPTIALFEPTDETLENLDGAGAAIAPAGAAGASVDDPIGAASTSFAKNVSNDSLISPDEQRRMSSFVRLHATPPDGVEDKSLHLASPLLKPGVLTIPPSDAESEDDGQPIVKKSKTTTTTTTISKNVSAPNVEAATDAASTDESSAPSRGSRKSKMAAAKQLKETSFDDSGVFVPPAPPKPKGAAAARIGKRVRSKKGDGLKPSPLAASPSAPAASASSKGGSSSSSSSSQNPKVGEVDMDTYKKMIVGQKAKPARSKSRKLSKSEEREIRAAADMKAKSKPMEYAAFDASSRFGEGLSFLDDTHVPTLHEFKQKQMNKPPSDVAAASAPTPSAPFVPAATSATLAAAPQTAVSSSPGVAEDFLTASATAPTASSTSSDSSSAPSECRGAAGEGKGRGGGGAGRGKGRGGGGDKRKVDYRESIDDDDDFVATRKKVTKPKGDAKKKNQRKQDEDGVFKSPQVTRSDRGRVASASSSTGSLDDPPEPVVVGVKEKNGRKKKKQSSLLSCGSEDEEGKETATGVDHPEKRRGRGGPQKSYAEPAMNKKMRR